MSKLFGIEWFKENQKLLLFFCNHWLFKYWFRKKLGMRECPPNEKIYELLPNNYTILSKDNYITSFRSRAKFSKNVYKALKYYWWTLHILDLFLDKYIPKLSFGFSSLDYSPDAHTESNTVDGSMGKNTTPSSWSTVRNASTGNADLNDSGTEAGVAAGDSGSYTWIYRAFAFFNTASLPDDATISAAVLKLYFTLQDDSSDTNTSFYVVGCNSSATTSLAYSDYGTAQSTDFGHLHNNEITVSADNNITLNSSAIAAISKTGLTRFAFRLGNDFSNTAPQTGPTYAGINFGTSDGTHDPVLTVTYSVPVTQTHQMIL